MLLPPLLHSKYSCDTLHRGWPNARQRVVMNLSITMSAAPSLHRFLGHFQTRFLGAQIQNSPNRLSQSSASAQLPRPVACGSQPSRRSSENQEVTENAKSRT